MDDKLKSFLNWLAAIVLSICVIGMLVGTFCCFWHTEPQTHHIVLTVSPDSIYDDAKFSYYTDSLINVINKHEHVIADRYEAILEDKEDAQRYWSIGGMLLSVVLGVAGFFGFKTIKDIEHNCNKTANSVASSVASQRIQKYLKTDFKREVREASDVYFGNQKSHITEMVKDEVERYATAKSDKFDELNDRLDEIEERLTLLEKEKNSEDSKGFSSPSENDNSTTVSSKTGEYDLFD